MSKAPVAGNLVCKLKKALYGLKQAPRLWYHHIHRFLTSLSFRRSAYNTNVYLRSKAQHPTVILLLYVDDILLFSSSLPEINTVKKELHCRYKTQGLGEAKQFLGMEIHCSSKYITLSQQRYMYSMLTKFGMLNSHGKLTPMQSGITLLESNTSKIDQQQYQSIVGLIPYLLLCTRPDHACTLSELSKHDANPREKHLIAANER